MLTARGIKRDSTNRFKLDYRLEILDDGKPIGQLVSDLGASKGELVLEGKSYVLGLEDGDRSGTKPPGKAFVLKDADGRILGSATQKRSTFIVEHDGSTFVLRRQSVFSRMYHLYPADNNTPVGWVGQQGFFNRSLHMDLPAAFAPPFRVFLLVLSFRIGIQKREQMSAYN